MSTSVARVPSYVLSSRSVSLFEVRTRLVGDCLNHCSRTSQGISSLCSCLGLIAKIRNGSHSLQVSSPSPSGQSTDRLQPPLHLSESICGISHDDSTVSQECSWYPENSLLTWRTYTCLALLGPQKKLHASTCVRNCGPTQTTFRQQLQQQLRSALLSVSKSEGAPSCSSPWMPCHERHGIGRGPCGGHPPPDRREVLQSLSNNAVVVCRLLCSLDNTCVTRVVLLP